MNTLRTIFFVGVLTALMVLVGEVLGGRQGMVLAFIFAVGTNLGAYWFSDKIALRMANAEPVSPEEAPELYEIVERLAQAAGIPTPPIYVTPDNSPNAFATGRDPSHSAVAVTQGILRLMSYKELEAVLAHELSHVRNRDVLITTMAAVLASVITMVAHWGMYFGGYRDEREGGSANPAFALLLVILAPIAATLINLAVSRSREYQADESGAKLCHHPEYLESALAKLDSTSRQIPMQGTNPALASLYIVKPNPQSFFVNLFSTHPPIEERIRRLKNMEGRV